VSLEVYAFNERAIHVYEKVGFRHEGRMRDALWWDGAPHDALLMSILTTEWDGSLVVARRAGIVGTAASPGTHAS